ncbi:BAI1-associated protein 3 [Clonorchis sinensis]|uniref:BAI1-associated protein 3 n=1 Tax=Clonorchis sinensis TaxID=79923 RepID=G7YV12_CLOSI|nr:BAI1-associated protein 3 [Clonorchis sinensis]
MKNFSVKLNEIQMQHHTQHLRQYDLSDLPVPLIKTPELVLSADHWVRPFTSIGGNMYVSSTYRRDHDEETSIVDAVRSLNEVRGVKQLGRYFKQVSQTARKGQTGDVDDFLGSITVDLKKLPLDEVDQWIKLEGRSAKSKVQGEIHIRLKLTTVEDGSDEPKLGEIKDHIMLLYEMIISELKRSKKPSTEWNGELSAAAQWLISQHAFQNGLSELQLAICSWICYSKVYRKMPIDCSIVLARLQELTAMWSDKELEQEHKRAVTNYELFKKTAEVPEGKLFGHIMNVDIRRIVIHLTNLTDDLRAADVVYSPIMQREPKSPHYLADFFQLHRELFEDSRLSSLVRNMLNTAQDKMEDGVEPEHRLDQNMLELFSLFHAIQKFELFEGSRMDKTREEQGTSPPGTLEELPIISPSAQKLIDDMRAMLFTWIECCWPAVDTYGLMAKMVLEKLFDSAISYARNLHEKLRLKGYCDEEGQFDISPQLCMALSALDRVIIWTQTIPESCGWSRRKSCTSERLEENFRLLDEVKQISPIVSCLERIPKEDLQALYEIQRSGVIEIRHVLDRIFYRVTAKMRPEIRKNVYHLCWCASTSPTEKALNDLLVYLESNFDTLRRQVSAGLLRRCFLEMWSECLEQFIEQAHKEAEVAPGIGGPGAYLNPPDSASTPNTYVIPLATHFTESQSPVAPNEVDPETVLRAKSTLLKLKHATELLLRFFIRTTNGLLEKYELENETYQDKTSKSSYGTLSISVSFQNSELIVEVRSASGLLPLDSNGLSDPFVVVDLLPRHIFKVSPKQMRTRIVKNSLDPIFNEQFEFTATEDELKHPSACLAFVIMDHDILLSDDLEGVSFLRLSTLFEPRREGGCRQGPSLNCVLPVMHPTHKKYSAFRVLSQRTDQYAQEVYKRWQPVEQDGSS